MLSLTILRNQAACFVRFCVSQQCPDFYFLVIVALKVSYCWVKQRQYYVPRSFVSPLHLFFRKFMLLFSFKGSYAALRGVTAPVRLYIKKEPLLYDSSLISKIHPYPLDSHPTTPRA